MANPRSLIDSKPDPAASDRGEAVCQNLCAVLRDGIDIHRCQAARALGLIGDSDAVSTLTGALIDEDEDVRADAATALAGMAPQEAAGPLLESLIGDPSAEVKAAAIEALARLNHKAAVPWLRLLVRSRSDDFTWDEDTFYEGGWDDWIDIQVASLKALAAMGCDEAVEDIVHAISDEDGQDLAEIGFEALTRMGDAGGKALVAFLGDASPRQRRRAAAAVVNAQSPIADEGIDRALADADAGVRMAAGGALAARNPEDARLETLFDDPDADVRTEIIHLCGAHFPGRMAVLADVGETRTRRAAIKLLDETPDLLDEETLDLIVRANLDNPDTETAGHAVSILGRSMDAGDDLAVIVADASRPARIRTAALHGMARSDTATPILGEVLGDEDRQVRLEALSILATLANRSDWPNKAGETLLSALAGVSVESPPEPVSDLSPAPMQEAEESGETPPPVSTLTAIMTANERPGAAETETDAEVQLTQSDLDFLELTKRSTAKRVVSTVAVPAHVDVPRLAARVLGDVAHPEVARALADRLTGGDADLRIVSADSLARVGNALGELPAEAIEKALEIVDHEDARLRLGIVRALGTSADETSLPALRVCLEDPDALVRSEAVAALARLGQRGPWLAPLLDDSAPTVRLAAAKAIAGAAEPDAVERLVDFAFSFSGHHARPAAGLLRTLDLNAANKAFCEALKDQGRVREWPVAIEALGELNAPESGLN